MQSKVKIHHLERKIRYLSINGIVQYMQGDKGVYLYSFTNYLSSNVLTTYHPVSCRNHQGTAW